MGDETLTVIDNRTGDQHTLPIQGGTIRAVDLRQIHGGADGAGLMSYDPAFMNTASCRSSITYLDGEKGILRYRGYPIEELAEKCTFLEVAYLLLNGELPTAGQLKEWVELIGSHTAVPENVQKLMEGFSTDAHPMGMLIGTLAALSTCYPDARHVQDAKTRALQIARIIAKMPTLAALGHRHSVGLPYVAPDKGLGYTENFMSMLWSAAGQDYEPNPVLARALDVLFILHADHEQNCSTSTMRAVGSSQADPYVSAAAAAAALSGPLHGGANEEVLRMLGEIGSVENIPAYIEKVKSGQVRLMGFGHRVYKNYDPRARIVKRIAGEVFEVTGRNPLLEVAMELERIALSDEYFIKRRLYPNVDFYTGIIYQAMGFPPEFFTVLFAVPRAAGWLAQWQEMLLDSEQKISRPRQVYTGAAARSLLAEASLAAVI